MRALPHGAVQPEGLAWEGLCPAEGHRIGGPYGLVAPMRRVGRTSSTTDWLRS